jgi:hypothetical protein
MGSRPFCLWYPTPVLHSTFQNCLIGQPAHFPGRLLSDAPYPQVLPSPASQLLRRKPGLNSWLHYPALSQRGQRLHSQACTSRGDNPLSLGCLNPIWGKPLYNLRAPGGSTAFRIYFFKPKPQNLHTPASGPVMNTLGQGSKKPTLKTGKLSREREERLPAKTRLRCPQVHNFTSTKCRHK